MVLALVILVAADLIPSLGKMKHAERGDEERTPENNEADNPEQFTQRPARVINFLLPVATLILATWIFDIDALIGVAFALLATLALFVAKDMAPLNRLFDEILLGLQFMLMPLGIVFAALILQDINEQLSLAETLIEWVMPVMSGDWLPAVTFLVLAGLAFATGSFWGVYAIAFPIVVPLAVATDASLPLALGAMISAGAFGSHACFFGDSTVLSARGCNITPLHFPGISLATFHFPASGRPTLLEHNLDDILFRRTLMPYLNGMYLLDPIFQHWEQRRLPGFWSLDELAPSDYFATYYRELGLYDEASAFFALGEDECLSPSFGFYHRSGSPEPADVLATLTYLFPLLNALVRQFWIASSLHLPTQDEPPALLQDFGKEVLSEREREVAWLILRGHSFREIAQALGIAPGTVKNHRKRLYARLNINSQGELFRQFMLFQQRW